VLVTPGAKETGRKHEKKAKVWQQLIEKDDQWVQSAVERLAQARRGNM